MNSSKSHVARQKMCTAAALRIRPSMARRREVTQEHALARQHDQGHAQVGSTCSSSNATIDNSLTQECSASMSHTKLQMVQTSRGETQHHQVHKSPCVHSLASQFETEVYRVTAVSRRNQQGEIPRTDAFAKLLVAFKQLVGTIAERGIGQTAIGHKASCWS